MPSLWVAPASCSASLKSFRAAACRASRQCAWPRRTRSSARQGPWGAWRSARERRSAASAKDFRCRASAAASSASPLGASASHGLLPRGGAGAKCSTAGAAVPAVCGRLPPAHSYHARSKSACSSLPLSECSFRPSTPGASSSISEMAMAATFTAPSRPRQSVAVRPAGGAWCSASSSATPSEAGPYTLMSQMLKPKPVARLRPCMRTKRAFVPGRNDVTTQPSRPLSAARPAHDSPSALPSSK
mmetsp:Transcript_18757/g.52994  ORF Transcript_18757/g.52994 Transcript_18757/m.52994 type:complete len:244 (-) Transcript_18757:529-1260(-)